jgi:hypothetical protein
MAGFSAFNIELECIINSKVFSMVDVFTVLATSCDMKDAL